MFHKERIEKMKKEIKKKIFFYVKLVISLVFFYLLFTKFVDVRKVITQISEIKYYVLILCLFVTLLSILLRALRWKIITKFYKKEISLKDALLFYFRGIYYGSVTPAKAGEFIKGYYYAQKYKISKGDGFSSVFFDRIFDIIFPLIFVTLYFLLGKVLNIFTSLLVIFLLTMFSWFVMVFLLKYLIKYIRKIKFLKDLTIPKVSFDYKLLLKGLLTLSIWSCYVLIGLIVLYSMNVYTIPIHYLFFSVCLASVAILIPITLNGWGIREGTYVFLFSRFVDANTGLLFSIILVLLSTYFLALIGLILEFTKFRKQ